MSQAIRGPMATATRTTTASANAIAPATWATLAPRLRRSAASSDWLLPSSPVINTRK